jgi:hypothetical protein
MVTAKWKRRARAAPALENARDLAHLWSHRRWFIASYWVHQQLVHMDLNLVEVVKTIVSAPLELRIEDKTVYLFRGVTWAVVPFSLCSPRECYLLLQLVEKNLFQRNIMPRGYRLKYHKFRYNAILDGHWRRCAVAEALCGVVVEDLDADATLVHAALVKASESATFENSPRRANLLRVAENVAKTSKVKKENIYAPRRVVQR